jgi:hypothetical protein
MFNGLRGLALDDKQQHSRKCFQGFRFGQFVSLKWAEIVVSRLRVRPFSGLPRKSPGSIRSHRQIASECCDVRHSSLSAPQQCWGAYADLATASPDFFNRGAS